MTEARRYPSTAASLARLYDMDLLEDPGDVSLYLALASRTGGPILEIAAGSGRIAIPLAEAGYEVTLVDIDAGMVARAKAAAGKLDPDVRARLAFVEENLVGLNLPGGPRFRLAILALNSILLLGTRELQQEALETMGRHLVPGGLAVVDIWLPSAEELAHYDGRLSLEYVRPDPKSGLTVTKSAAAQYEPATGHVNLTVIYDEGKQGGAARRWIREDRLTLLNASDLRSIAESAGLVVEVVAGDYDLNAVSAHDERAILVARRRGRPAARP
ncbi:MAG TPA: class I SAM-dependent methyltransferase [Terriglobales bacterium]|nr:class I SAM-dependent methyltransferase [Terriglobales bacterium]